MSVVKTYAKAFQKVGVESKAGLEGLRLLSATYVSEVRLQKALESPNVLIAEKIKIIEMLCAKLGASKLAQGLAVMMLQHRAIHLLPQVTEEIDRTLIEAAGGARGEIYTAEVISDTDLEVIRNAFKKKLGKHVELRQKIDQTLIAGVKVVIQGVTYDGSMKTRIEQFRESVMAKVGTA